MQTALTELNGNNTIYFEEKTYFPKLHSKKQNTLDEQEKKNTNKQIEK